MRLDPTERWRDDKVELFVMTLAAVSDSYVGWLADPEVNRFLESRFSPQPRAAVEQFVTTLLASEEDILFGIRDLESGRHIGNVRLGPIDFNHRRAEVGIVIGDRQVRGRGLAPAALTLLAGIAQEELALRKLAASCYGANEGSQRAFVKAGFVIEGARPAHMLVDGFSDDLVLMGRVLGAGRAGVE